MFQLTIIVQNGANRQTEDFKIGALRYMFPQATSQILRHALITNHSEYYYDKYSFTLLLMLHQVIIGYTE